MHPGPMLPPGDRNWQHNDPNGTAHFVVDLARLPCQPALFVLTAITLVLLKWTFCELIGCEQSISLR